ncbi:PepSY domain-containing protein [Simiduia agarivorans]|uniref:PepSY domain-containing protein n=1 Tax=Simiduia agarivorans TaxID=447471 RepID=UPI0009DC1C89|nr:PepSY domain-containing protein [Simiduia agarivorans]
MLRKFWRPILWRWHKRIGLTLILLLLWLSVTGIFLNHTDDLDLAEAPLGSPVLLRAYGVDKVPATHIQVPSGQWLSQSGDYLYLDGERVSACYPGAFSVAPLQEDVWAVLCDLDILVLARSGQVLERLGASYGIPQPMTALGFCADDLCLKSGTYYYSLDLDNLRWTLLDEPDFSRLPIGEAPDLVLQHITDRWLSREVNWERLMLDLHAGRVFGLGPWLMDAVAILTIILCLSGLGIWLAGRKRR